MVRVFAAAAAASLVLAASPLAPVASAAGGDQTIRVQNGQIRCLLSADWKGQGRSATVCGRADGGPFGVSPAPLNLVVVLGSGQLWFEAGTLPDPAGDVVLGVGQTSTVNGWNIKSEELQTLIWNDDGGHGLRINPVDAAAIWI